MKELNIIEFLNLSKKLQQKYIEQRITEFKNIPPLYLNYGVHFDISWARPDGKSKSQKLFNSYLEKLELKYDNDIRPFPINKTTLTSNILKLYNNVEIKIDDVIMTVELEVESNTSKLTSVNIVPKEITSFKYISGFLSKLLDSFPDENMYDKEIFLIEKCLVHKYKYECFFRSEDRISIANYNNHTVISWKSLVGKYSKNKKKYKPLLNLFLELNNEGLIIDTFKQTVNEIEEFILSHSRGKTDSHYYRYNLINFSEKVEDLYFSEERNYCSGLAKIIEGLIELMINPKLYNFKPKFMTKQFKIKMLQFIIRYVLIVRVYDLKFLTLFKIPSKYNSLDYFKESEVDLFHEIELFDEFYKTIINI